MPLAPELDAITVAALREVGSVKWTAYPGKLGAYIAEMDYGTAPAVRQALHTTIDTGRLGYLPLRLVERMAEAYARWSAERYGWSVAPERVRPLADVLAGMAAVIEHFSRPGSPVVVPTPAYMPFLTLPGTLGREVIQLPMLEADGRHVYDLDALDGAFARGAGLLVLCNPHNPVGRVLERAELEAVSQVVDRHGARVFVDEIHAPLVYPGHAHVPYASVSDAAARHSVTATSAAKAWNIPGLKCAQLVLSNDEDAQTWAEVGTFAEHGASTPGVIASTAAYAAGGPWLDEVIQYLDGNRTLLADLLADTLPGVGYRMPEGTYLAWLDCRRLDLGGAPGEFFLREADIATVEGTSCGTAGEGFVRLNFAMPRPVLEQAVSQMAAAVARCR
ncbi:aminotransferase class I/II-fold pyridoxal phosphate-dependent enzyme [Xylanimonas allomyrinae]|uniref:cysteine-S-conjugate beta-lyase n=1 Tax=Xylanimonas allomyrinae TaxID=2509459 RepID=A0A4P6EVA9_9MICO|nr:aminotransferase class I/II-fold pyridoxal phosphate-dependent enzyme [Xylanimonas allomyrinae]QAY61978.1 aminotransferase class I/II-fold pyridoxal phosphate-dependent enzyme [Xylanimonas allomyrinae]